LCFLIFISSTQLPSLEMTREVNTVFDGNVDDVSQLEERQTEKLQTETDSNLERVADEELQNIRCEEISKKIVMEIFAE